ncbi:MAG: hypothetical protein WDW38_010824 [Sanguina aurantia]
MLEIQDFALQEAAPGCSWNHFHFTYQDLNIHALHLQASATKDTPARNDKPPTDASSLQTPGGSSSQDVVIDVLESRPDSGKPNLLLIHGTGSSSAAWIPIMQRLAETFNILAVDLPGFGRSDGPTSLRSSSREETIDFYCDFLQTYLQAAGLSQVVLVAHSYGCYIASHFASRHPHLVTKLFLACPAGTLSTQSHQGAWLAPIFTITTPQATAQLLGMFGRAGLFLYFDMKRCPDFVETYYRWELWLRSSAHHTIKQFVRRELMYSSWTEPVLPLLLQLPMPVALFYGERDRIIPSHNGPAIVQLADSDVPCYIIEGADHSPFRGEGGHVKFVSAVVDAHTRSAVPFGAKAALLGASLDLQVLQTYKTSYSLKWSLDEIQRQYKMLADLAAAEGIRPGRVIFVGEEITSSPAGMPSCKAASLTDISGGRTNAVTVTATAVVLDIKPLATLSQTPTEVVVMKHSEASDSSDSAEQSSDVQLCALVAIASAETVMSDAASTATFTSDAVSGVSTALPPISTPLARDTEVGMAFPGGQPSAAKPSQHVVNIILAEVEER